MERKFLSVRVPGDVYDALKAESTATRLSMNEVAVEALVLRLRSPAHKVLPWLKALGWDRRGE